MPISRPQLGHRRVSRFWCALRRGTIKSVTSLEVCAGRESVAECTNCLVLLEKVEGLAGMCRGAGRDSSDWVGKVEPA